MLRCANAVDPGKKALSRAGHESAAGSKALAAVVRLHAASTQAGSFCPKLTVISFFAFSEFIRTQNLDLSWSIDL